MIQLIALDIDGTIVDSKGVLHSPIIEATDASAKAGIKLVICSGRPFESVESFAKALEVKDYIICLNGCELRSLETRAVLEAVCLPGALAVDIFRRLEQESPLLSANIYLQDRILYFGKNNVEKIFHKTCRIEEATMQQLLQYAEKDEIRKIELCNVKYSSAAFRDSLISTQGISLFGSWEHSIECVSHYADKGIMLQKLTELLNISREQVMAVGDYNNDLGMIRFAGVGVAMGNALPELKAVARYITEDCDHNGAAKAIRRYLMGMKPGSENGLDIV